MKKIKIIDDDIEIVENITAILKKEGYSITMMDTTEGAIEEILRDKPDIVLLDVMFPENPAGGFDLSREIRKVDELKSLPIILLTSINQEFPMDFSSKDIDSEWFPVNEFLEKPVDVSILLEKIDKLIQK